MSNPITANNQSSTVSDIERHSFPVVGLGASAGGLKALLQFFELMPASSGMAFVVILHLSPKHESHSADLLQNVTKMSVTQVNEPVRVEPNRVYVIPPTQHLQMLDGTITLKDLPPGRTQHVAVDLFFRTLADAHKDRAVCIVLSGTGSDGAVGLTRVKEEGGIAIAQSPDDAEYDGMPRNAIGTGVVDFVLPVAEIPNKLIQLWQNASVIKLPPAEEQIRIVDPTQAAEEALRQILLTLRARTGHDFIHYKRATVLRRIERRMQVNQLPDLPAYLNYLREHQQETPALLRDMLISVTNFFRDREAFEALEREVIPRLFAGKTAQDQVRVWVAGCATGEEAYSIAMLLVEHAAGMAHPPGIQVFATDIDENMTARAREGRYPESIVTDIAPARLRNFFTKEAGGYLIKKQVRERVLFAAHNVLKDPPFSRLDLISCRNMMIYLTREVQEQILALFHFSLRPGSCLFLGSSESADSVPNLFAPLDKKHRLFRGKVVARANMSVPTLPLTAPPRKIHLLADGMSERRRVSFGELHQRLLEQYAPPSVIITHDHDIVHLSDRAGRFLQFAGGEPSHNLLKVIHPELRLDLRTALFQAIQSRKSVEARRVRLVREGRTYYVNMIARPVESDDAQQGYVLVIFDEVEDILGTEGKEPQQDGAPEPLVHQLESELHRTKDLLQATIEQYETTNEEMKASNEELQAINEELRSTTEELETSKEELQSINEELMTVNFELKSKVDEATHANDDLKNLISATEIATVFVDRSLKIRRFTPRAVDLFNFILGDIGRPLLDITHRLAYPALAADAEQVLATLTPLEREVMSADGRRYSARLLPYRTLDDRIDGVVLNFVEITARRQAEQRAHLTEARMRLIVESAKDYAIFTTDLERRITSWSTGAQAMFSYTESEITGQSADLLFTPEDRQAGVPAREVETALATGRAENERYHSRKNDEARFYGSGVVMPLRDDTETIVGFVKIIRDLSEQKRTADLLRAGEQRLQRMVNVPHVGVLTFDYTGKLLHANDAFLEMAGYDREEFAARQFTWRDFTPPEHVEASERVMEQLRQTGRGGPYEKEYFRKDGSRIWLMFVGADLGDGTLVEYGFDISASKRLEAAQRELEVRQRLALSGAEVGTFVWHVAEDRGEPDAQMLALFGLRTGDTLSLAAALTTLVHPDDRQRYANAVAQATDATGAGELREEIRVVHPDCSTHWLAITAQTVFDEGELPRRALEMYGIATNITERKRAEEDLRVSEERVRLATEAAAFGIWDWDYETPVMDWSRQLFEILGLPPTTDLRAELDDFKQLVHPEDWPGLFEASLQARDQHTRFNHEYRIHRADTGEERWIAASQHFFYNQQGQAVRCIGLARDVTHRKESEVALRQSQNFVQGIVTSIPLSLYIFDLRQRKNLYLSPQVLETFGYTPEQMQAQDTQLISELFHPDDWSRLDAHFQRIQQAREDEIFELEYRMRHANGSWVWVHSRDVVYQRDEQGLPTQILGAAEDITTRKQAEEQLRASELRFRATFEQANVGIVQLTSDGHFLVVNPGFCKIVGYSEEELQISTVRDITHPDDFQLEQAENQKMLTGEISGYTLEKRFVCKDGQIVWGTMTGTLVRHPSGEPLYMLAIVEDVTARKQIEETLRGSEERLRLLIESVKDYAIITMDTARRITGWNAGAQIIFGYTMEEIAGQSADLIFTPEDRERGAPEREAAQAIETGRASDDRWHLHKDGARIYVSGVMSALRDGPLSGFVKIARDLTASKQTEEEQRERRKELEVAVQARTLELSQANITLQHEVGERRNAEERIKDLLRTVITAQEGERQRISRELHDHLGQLLTALRLNLETIGKRGDKALAATLAQAQDVTKQLDAAVDFLAWELRPAALEDVGLTATIANYAMEWSKHFDIEAEFHGGASSSYLSLTPETEINLYRIAQEALNNIAKHAQARHVDVLLERRNKHLVLIIEDDGIGFEPDEEAKPRPSGRGLGLIGMNERAALIGGTVEIESTPGSGTTVFVRVPLPESVP